MDKIICVKELYKNYGKFKAVKGISFDVHKGNLFAFLGTNGAGKSTTIDILTTLIRKTDGEVLIDGLQLGKDDSKIKEIIGAVFQNSVLDDILTVRENLLIRGSLYAIDKIRLNNRIQAVSKITECDGFMDKRYGRLSGGQKRRADIACALINEPKILFLDEPTTGLDPATRISIWDTVASMQKTLKMTVFLTTHYMEEAVNADDVVIIQSGNIVAKGSPNELREKYTSNDVRIYNPNDNVLSFLKDKKVKYRIDKNIVYIPVSSSDEVINLLSNLKSDISSFEVINGNMDDVFMSIVNRKDD